MMQAPPGIFAIYTREGPPRQSSSKPVIAFADDGTALVAGMIGSLVPAHTLTGFDHLTDSGDGPEFIALIPADGWRIESTLADGRPYSEPIVAWALTPAGRVTPLYVNNDNLVTGTFDPDGEFLIYHPDGSRR